MTSTPEPGPAAQGQTLPALAVVILAAGRGARMRSALHKVLHPVAHKPMLLHLLDSLEALSPQRRIVVLGVGRAQVEAALAGRDLETVHQAEPLGTGHAAAQAAPLLAGFDGVVLILPGDCPLVTPATMQRLVQALNAETAVAVLGFRPPEPGRYGRILAEDGKVLAMVEARDATPAQLAAPLCNAGIMAVRAADLWPRLARLTNLNAAGEYYLPDVATLAIADGLAVRVIEAPADEVLGANSRAELAVLEAAFQARARASAQAGGATLVAPETVFLAADTRLGEDVTIEPFVVFGPGVTVEAGSRIRAHSHLEGAHIGSGCEVGPFARLRPGTRLEDGAKVGNFVEVKASTLGPGAKANHLSYIGDTLVGAHANIGAGTITCNYDGFAKHRTRIGAGAFIGSNTALVAPVSVGEGAIVAAGSIVTRDVAADSLHMVRAATVEKPGWAARLRAARQARKG